RMRQAIENCQVAKLRYFQCLSDRAEGFNCDVGLDAGAFTPLFPISAGPLGDLEVGDFDLPTRRHVLPRYKPRERALTNITFLRYHTDESGHTYHSTPQLVLAH